MKIFSTAPEGNEASEMENIHYIKLAIEKLEKSNLRLKVINKPFQVMLTHIDVLLIFARKFPVNSNLLIKKDRVQEWKTVFNEWFERCGSKIPAKFREGIKKNADELFAELETYGH